MGRITIFFLAVLVTSVIILAPDAEAQQAATPPRDANIAQPLKTNFGTTPSTLNLSGDDNVRTPDSAYHGRGGHGRYGHRHG
jgi:hypothetical protein